MQEKIRVGILSEKSVARGAIKFDLNLAFPLAFKGEGKGVVPPAVIMRFLRVIWGCRGFANTITRSPRRHYEE